MDSLISVIIPVYNVSQYLARCVNSVIAQNYQNIEIILVDDGATDDSGQMCDAFALQDPRVRVVHKTNGGLSSARNAGIQIARGEYLTFIDSDDYVDTDYVEFLYRLICQYPAKMSICSHTVMYDNGTVLHKATEEQGLLDSRTVLERILYDEDIDLSAWAKLYHRSLFETILFPEGRLFEDAATTYRYIHASGQVALGLSSKLYYMIRSNSISNASFTEKKLDLITSTQEMADFCKANYPGLDKAADRRLMHAYLSTLSQLANSSVNNPPVKKQLMGYIRKHGLSVLLDPRAKNRDRLGIVSTVFGFRFYQWSWNLYRKITGRI